MVSHRDDTAKGVGSIEDVGQLHEAVHKVLDSKQFLPLELRRKIAKKIFKVLIFNKALRSEVALNELIEDEIRKID